MDKQNIEDIKGFNKDQAEEQLASDIQAWLNDDANNTDFTVENLAARYDEIQNLEEQKEQLFQHEQEEKRKRKNYLITEIQSGKRGIYEFSARLIVSAAIAGFFGILTVKAFIYNSTVPKNILSDIGWTLEVYKIAIQYAETAMCSVPTCISGISALANAFLLSGTIKEYIDNKKELKSLNNVDGESEKKGRRL